MFGHCLTFFMKELKGVGLFLIGLKFIWPIIRFARVTDSYIENNFA